jgi:flagellar hook-basal body complex protein FliE
MSIETMRSISGMSPETGVGSIDRSPPGPLPAAASPASPASGGGFAETLGSAIQKVDDMQMDADAQAEKVALGGGNLHEMSLALEKADVSMRLAMKVRNKLIDAYQEIMRMSV